MVKAVDVENLKNAISRITGVCPYQQILLIEGRETPLSETEVLADVSADVCAQGDESLALNVAMVVDNEKHARGPFALGQEKSWGCWDSMSNCSGPLSGFDGRWERQDRTYFTRFFMDEVEITGTQGLDASGRPFEFHVKDGKVFTTTELRNTHNYLFRWWQTQGEHLCSISRAGDMIQRYSRIQAARRPQRISTPARMSYTD